jgi:hypothetical protein
MLQPWANRNHIPFGALAGKRTSQQASCLCAYLASDMSKVVYAELWLNTSAVVVAELHRTDQDVVPRLREQHARNQKITQRRVGEALSGS